MCQVIDAIWNGSAKGITWKIMGVDHLWLVAPYSSSILEIADQFLLLGIRADHRISGVKKQLLDARDIPELAVSVWMRWTGKSFAVGLQRILQIFQQTSNRHPADLISLFA
jgi:hypothetical protein